MAQGTSRAAEALAALRASFRNQGLRRLQLAWAGCASADLAQDVALSVYVFSVQGVAGVGIVGLVRALPAGVLGPLATGVADRHDRRRVLVAVLVVRAVLLGALAAVLVSDAGIVVVYVLTAVDAIVYTLYWPAQSSLMLELARTPEELTASNAAATTVENLGVLVGPALAGVLLTVSGPGLVLAASAVTLGLGAVVLAGIQAPPRHRPAAAEPVGERIFGGFRALLRDRVSLAVVLLYLVQVLCLGALSVLIVVTALELLGTGQAGVGFLTAVVGGGGVVGSMAALGLVGRRRLTQPFRLALGLWGVALALVPLAPRLVVVVAALAVVGSCTAVIDVAAVNLLQRIVPERVLGRVLGVVEGAWWAAFGLGSIGAAALVGATTPRIGLAVTAGLSVAAAVVAAAALRPADERAQPPARELAALRGVPMLAAQSPLALERLALRVVPVTVDAGVYVIREGDSGDRFYVIDDGRVLVRGESVEAELGAGDWFGEIALLGDVPRTASVRAITAVRLFALDRADFLGAVAAQPVTGRGPHLGDPG